MIWHKTSTGPRVRNANKYHAKKTVIEVEGKPHTFDSHAEALYYLQLAQLQRTGEVLTIELQPRFELQPAYWKCCGEVSTNMSSKHICWNCGKKIPKTTAITYKADFRVTYVDGHQEIVDVKGVPTRDFVRSKKEFEYHFPELSIKVVPA
jgi:hypothetical protein